mgnify:FL=1
MSELTDTHNIQLTDIEIFVLKYILKNLDVDLKLNFFKDGKKNFFTKRHWWLCTKVKGSRK